MSKDITFSDLTLHTNPELKPPRNDLRKLRVLEDTDLEPEEKDTDLELACQELNNL